MRRRTYTTLTSLVVVALLVGWLPNSDWLRARIASALTGVAAEAGFVVAFERVEGYAWRGLTLVEPRLAAAGAVLAAERVRVDWFLPSLLVGELPLRLDVRGLRGDVEVGRWAWPAASTAAPPALRVRLDAVRVDGADLAVAEIPYALPDVRVELLEATSLDDGRWRVEATLATADGRLRGALVGRLGEAGFEVALHEADARVARHWWDGVEAGTIAGGLTWGPSGADGHFELTGGVVRSAGATVEGVSGPIAWRGDLIEVAWTGRALGGRVDVGGSVDVAAARWRADGEVDVAFADATGALWTWLGAPAVPAAEAGRVRGRVEVAGWTEARVAADLEVDDGSWLGASLELPELRVRYDPVAGLSVAAEGRWGDGPLRLATRPAVGRLQWTAEAGPLRVRGVPIESAVAGWTTGGGAPTARAELRGGEGPWSASADLVLDAEGLQAFLAGTLFDGPFEGALVAPTAALDAPIEGGLRWSPPTVGWSGAPRFEARLAGSFGAPRATVELLGEGPVAPRAEAEPAPNEAARWSAAIGAVTERLLVGLDLRGAVEAAWSAEGARIEGRLGPLALRGAPDGWTFELDALPLGGPLTGRIGPGRGAWLGGRWSATVASEVGTAAGPTGGSAPWLATPELLWSLEGDADGATAVDATGAWRGTLGGAASATLSGAEIAVVGRPAQVDATWDDGVGEARVALDDAVARVRWAGGQAGGRLEVGAGVLLATWSDGTLALDGDLDLAAAGALLAPTLGAAVADVAGTARLDATWRVGVDELPAGGASLALTAPWPASVELAGDGRLLRWAGRADAPGGPLRSEGSWAPGRLEGEVAWGTHGALRIGLAGAEGSGTWAGGRFGEVVVEPQPWRVEIDPRGRALATLGASRATFDPATGRVDARVDLDARWGEAVGRVEGRAAWSVTEAGGAPDGLLDLAIVLGDDARAVATGGLDGVTVQLEGSAARWAAGATPLLAPTGGAALAGEVDGFARWRPDEGFAADLRWSDRLGGPVRLTLERGALEATGAGWSARLDGGTNVTLAARDARLDPLLRRADATLRLDGDLRLDLGDGDGAGALQVGLEALGVAVAGELAFEGGALVAAGDVASAGLQARLRGPVSLAPEVGWSGTWTWDGLAAPPSAGAGTFELGAGGIRLAGALEAEAGRIGPLAWPAFGLDVGLDDDGALRAVGTGGLRGRWPDGLRADVELLGVPHTASLQPAPAGWRVDLVGATLTAGWTGDLDGWSLDAVGGWAGLDLGLQATGAGTRAQGGWWAGAQAASDAWARGTLAFDGAALELALAGADLAPAAPLGLDVGAIGPVAGSLRGRIDADGWSVAGDLGAPWGLGGVGGTVDVRARGTAVEVDVAADLFGAGTTWRLAGDLATLPEVDGTVAAVVADVVVAGRFTTGGARGIALELASDDGAWQLDAAGLDAGRARLRGPAGLDLTATWALEPALAATLTGGFPGVDLAARVGADAAGAPRLELEAGAPDGAWAATLAGPVDPWALRGSLTLGGAPAPLSLDAAPAWRLAWGDLVATPAGGGVELRGRSAPGQLPLVALVADPLGWSPSLGWWGRGRVEAAPGFAVEASAALVGDGDLTADVALSWEGRPAGTATLRLPADPTVGLSGEANLRVPLPLPEGGPWTLIARGPLAAGAGGWGAELALELEGAVEARGALTIADGALVGRLEGDGLRFDGRWAAGAGEGRLRVVDLDVAGPLPWLDRPRLSGEARVDLVGEALTWWVDDLRLALPGGAVEGGGVAHPDGRLQATLRVDVDLADVRGSGPWSGRVGGPVTFAGRLDAPLDGAVAARLEARDVAWSTFEAVWQGDVVVSGRAGDPTLEATWVARGSAADLDGGASWRPEAGVVTLRAAGTAWGVAVDLDLGWGPGGFDGGGRVEAAGTSWTLGAAQGRLEARGVDAWSGWRATLDPSSWRAELAGDLAALPYARGTFAGTVDLVDERRPVVALGWRDLEVAGLALGDGRAEGDAVAGWRLLGDRLEASLAPDAARWEVALREVPTPVGGTWLTLRARADPEGRVVEGAWWGATPVGQVDLALALDDLGGAWRGALSGSALDGRLNWPIAWVDGGWAGRGRLDGATLLGRPLAADLEVGGALAAPEVAVGVVAGDLGAWRADVRWAQGAALVGVEAPLPAGGTATVRGRAWPDVDLVVDAGAAGRVRLTAGWSDRPLRLDGALDLPLGPVQLVVQGPATLRLHLPTIGGGLRATLPARPIAGVIDEVRRDGWRWIGEGAWSGELLVARAGGPLLEVVGLDVDADAFRGTIAGRIDVAAADLALTVDLAPLADALTAAGGWSWQEPIRARLSWSDGILEVTSEAPWGSRWRLDPTAGSASVDLDLQGSAAAGGVAPSARGVLRLDARGWSGELQVATVTDALGEDPAALDARVLGVGDHLALSATLRGPRGSATATGRWDAAALRPADWGPAATPLRELEVRVVGLDLGGFAGARALSGSVTGSASLRGDALFGRLTSGALTLGARTAPAVLEFQGDLADPAGPSATGRLDLGGATADLHVDPLGVGAYARFERFPLHELVAAALGPSDVVAEVTGALRGSWAWGAAAPSDLRVASERIRLERAGVETRGQLAFEWDGASLTIGEASFEGRGAWQLRGSATPELLDLELLAQAADFGPLLGLVPAFASYGVTAQGNLALSARGTPSAPDVLLRTDDLELGVAGTRYRLEDVRLTLQGEAWTGRAEIAALDPLQGRLTLVSEGRVGPFPDRSFSLAARAVGGLDVPFVGRVDDLVADLAWSDAGAPTLAAVGRLGEPFTLAGPLAPLDLQARGSGLRLAIPFLFVADATLDADLRLVADAGGVALSGRVDATQARVDLGARGGGAGAAGTEPPLPVEIERGTTVEAPPSEARRRFRFDGVRIVAPQRVTFAESFGNADASVDLTLDGTLAEPRLSGAIRAMRGAVRFAGRELELIEAVATFDPTRGVLPGLRVAARTDFDKARVLGPGTAVRFLAPAGPRFSVELRLEGEATMGVGGFALDLQPQLASDAVVDGVEGGGARPLTELELLTLLTLGRLEGASGVAGAVAQSALDTAVELLVTAELQAILADALGVDVVELRTTAVSTLIDGTDPFGVSLRLGGYVSEEVFASYRISTLGGATFSNEVAFAYQLGPVAVDITGRFDVAAGVAATTPSLAVGARYGFAPGWALELGVDLSTERSTARLGVTWRW